MLRLRDQSDSSDPAMARAAKILSCASPFDAERFWNGQPPVRGTSRPRALPLRTAAVLAMSLGSFAASAAILPRFHVWDVSWATTLAVTGPQAGAAPASPPRPTPVVAAAVASPPAGAAPIAPPPALASAASVVPRPAGAVRIAVPRPSAAPSVASAIVEPAVAPLPRPEVPVPSRAAAVPAGSESSLMIEAVRALRRDRDPARALSLAEVAMDRYPEGAQIEEAMALAMEAAKAAGDGAAARRLAERYLASFRTGHFADRAQQIVSAPLR